MEKQKKSDDIKTIQGLLKFVSNIRKSQNIEEYEKFGLSESKQKAREIFKENGYFAFMDYRNVCMIKIENEQIFNIILNSFDLKDSDFCKDPVIDYKMTGIAKCKYSCEYLKILYKLCDLGYETVELTIKEDYPLTAKIKNLGLTYILAPRIDDS